MFNKELKEKVHELEETIEFIKENMCENEIKLDMIFEKSYVQNLYADMEGQTKWIKREDAVVVVVPHEKIRLLRFSHEEHVSPPEYTPPVNSIHRVTQQGIQVYTTKEVAKFLKLKIIK